MIVLALDTSGHGDQVGIFEAGKSRGTPQISQEQHASKTILSNIHQVLESASLQLNQIDLIAVTTGPGSFTGIRVGLSVAKAFSKIHSTPAIGVSSLAGLIFPFRESQRVLIPCIQARGEEVYSAAYRWIPERNELESLLPEKLWMLSDLLTKLKNIETEKMIVGSGAWTHRKAFSDLPHPQIPEEGAAHTIQLPSVAQLGELKWNQRQGKNLPLLVPNYLRPSEAELKLLNKNS